MPSSSAISWSSPALLLFSCAMSTVCYTRLTIGFRPGGGTSASGLPVRDIAVKTYSNEGGFRTHVGTKNTMTEDRPDSNEGDETGQGSGACQFRFFMINGTIYLFEYGKTCDPAKGCIWLKS